MGERRLARWRERFLWPRLPSGALSAALVVVALTAACVAPGGPTPAESEVLATSKPTETPERARPTATPPAPTPTPGAATPTPSLADMEVEAWRSTSDDGDWVADGVVAFPKGVGDQYYTSLEVSLADGSVVWRAVDEWRPIGLGWTSPRVLRWSRDGGRLYFTNLPVPDGCALFVNGYDLQALDLATGEVTELVPGVGLWLSLSPDERRLAYIGVGKRGLVLRDLASGEERGVRLDPGREYAAGGVLWSPDGSALVLTIAFAPCAGEEWAESTSIVVVDAATLETKTLIAEDARLLVTEGWPTPDRVLLRDSKGDPWWMDPLTGQVTSGE